MSDNYATTEHWSDIATAGAITAAALGIAAFTATGSNRSTGRPRPSELLPGLDLRHTAPSASLVPQPAHRDGEWHIECRPIVKGAIVPFLAGLFCAAFVRAFYHTLFRI
ncbi:hypothetical protein FRC00_000720 [Tulasnella sp. 408]|nr:hypothetical protein FRC00_000720 [Tulasnella sp. 408]